MIELFAGSTAITMGYMMALAVSVWAFGTSPAFTSIALVYLVGSAVAAIAPLVEDRGIDEIFIDLTDVPGAREPVGGDPLGGARALAARLQQAVREATGLSCSIGVTPNKLLSKLASDFQKPGGVTLLMADEIPARVWPLPASRINGIGPKASARLAEMGIHCIGELAGAPLEQLLDTFGASYGRWLHDAAHGRDERPVVTWREPKSISRETTFERDLHARADRAQLSEIFTALCVKLAGDLERKGYVGRTIGIKLKYADFQGVTRDVTLPAPTGDATTIRQAAGECLKRVPLEKKLRLLGVRVGALSRKDELALTAQALQAELPFGG